MNNNKENISSISLKYAEDIVKTIAISQRNNLLNDKTDLEMIIAAGLELALSEIIDDTAIRHDQQVAANSLLVNSENTQIK